VKCVGKLTLGANDDITYTNTTGTNRQFLQSDGAGNTSWSDISNVDISKSQIDYTTAYQQVTYQGTNSGNANYIQSSNNTNVIIALNDMSAALATLATAVQKLNDKYVIN